jgi:hypothetical protein
MNRKYDVFEKFSDGSSLWRACVSGLENTRIHLHEMSRQSKNQFYAIDIAVGKVVRLKQDYEALDFLVARKADGRRSPIVA